MLQSCEDLLIWDGTLDHDPLIAYMNANAAIATKCKAKADAGEACLRKLQKAKIIDAITDSLQ